MRSSTRETEIVECPVQQHAGRAGHEPPAAGAAIEPIPHLSAAIPGIDLMQPERPDRLVRAAEREVKAASRLRGGKSRVVIDEFRT